MGPRDALRRAGTVAFWLAVWQLASMAVASELLLAGPVAVLVRLARLVPTAAFWSTAVFSLARIAVGFALAFVSGLALGLAAHRWRSLAELFAPAVSFLKSVPIVCVIVLLLMWVGPVRVSAIAVFLAVFPAIYFCVLEGRAAADLGLGELLRVMGVSGWRRFLADTWQQLLPYLVATCRNACGMAWKAGVAAELIGSPRGSMGERVYQAKLLLETGDLFAWTIVVVALSWACERAFLALLRSTGGWAIAASMPRSRHAAVRRRSAALAPTAPAPAGISFESATLGYDGAPVATCNLSLAAGSRTVLSDPSGAGKSTLVRAVCGLLVPLSGRVMAPGWGRLSVQFQDARLVEAMTAEQNVLLCSAGALSWEGARSLLAELLPEDAVGRPVTELSGGQRRRVELARALAHPGAAVVLDEPFASLDAASHGSAAAFVLRHLDGRTLLVASHAPGDVALLRAQSACLGDARGNS
ncbi:ATP-binding cassette domain-containing protein [Tractidigestivibacter sp.]|uniref:ATP-binding cassette domain-containing protein n=1 Tax=Tractidigestivibacter sp. TaxID=2847320 RepID=UPI002A91E922|nr:ATP-binding cassette domain-containing protein [Tractidigestivibacter sp.]MDY5270883.1 ATP-binding cassette domain-containing protein [Tractidigestivibacter sp.]